MTELPTQRLLEIDFPAPNRKQIFPTVFRTRIHGNSASNLRIRIVRTSAKNHFLQNWPQIFKKETIRPLQWSWYNISQRELKQIHAAHFFNFPGFSWGILVELRSWNEILRIFCSWISRKPISGSRQEPQAKPKISRSPRNRILFRDFREIWWNSGSKIFLGNVP